MSVNVSQMLPFILFGLALLIALWLIYRAMRKTTVVDRNSSDVLDEGAAPAARNQALIDSAKAAAPQPPAAPEAKPVAAPTLSPAPAASGEADDLRKIKGVGPKLVAVLKEQGVTTFAQVAAWSDADVARIDATLGRFAGRIERDQWVEQAKLLASGEDTAFSAKFGNDG